MKRDLMIYGILYFILAIPILWNLYKANQAKKLFEASGLSQSTKKDAKDEIGFEIGLYLFFVFVSYLVLAVWRLFSDATWDFERHILNANLLTVFLIFSVYALYIVTTQEPSRKKHVVVNKWVSESLKQYMEETRNTDIIGWHVINKKDIWLEYGSPEFQHFLAITKDAEKWVKTKRVIQELQQMRHNYVDNQQLVREADGKLQQLGWNIKKELEQLLPVLSGIEEKSGELKAYLESFVNETDEQGVREPIEITELKAILKRDDMPEDIRQSAKETLEKIHEKQQEPNPIIDPFMEAQAIIRAARMKHYLE